MCTQNSCCATARTKWFTPKKKPRSVWLLNTGNDSVFDYIEINEDYSIYEIGVPASWVGKSILDKKGPYQIQYQHFWPLNAGKRFIPFPTPTTSFSETESFDDSRPQRGRKTD